MNLKTLSTSELDRRIKTLVQNERDLLCEVLLTIKEIDTRKLYLDLGFPSLFAYLVSIGYQGGSAQRRIDAVRLMKEIPTLSEKIQSGSTSLNQVSFLQKAIRQSAKKVTTTQKELLLTEISNQTRRESEKALATFFEIPVVDAEFQTAQANDSVRIEMTISKALYTQIQEAQEYLSHSLPNREIKSYLEYLTAKVLKQKNKELKNQSKTGKAEMKKNELNSKPTKENKPLDIVAKNASENETNNGITSKRNSSNRIKSSAVKINHFRAEVALPVRVRRQMLNTHQECQHKNPVTGQKCQSRWHLQVDHKQSRWAHGQHNPENLQVLCAGHNQLKYRKEQGVQLIST